MALSERQSKALLKMFSNSIMNEKIKERREQLYWEFEDSFKGVILNWEDSVHVALVENKVTGNIISEWQEYQNRSAAGQAIDDIVIGEMRLEDEKAIVNLLMTEVGCIPVFAEFTENGSVNEFKDTGYSFVAKKGEELVGVMMAQKQMDYGSAYLFINNYAVTASFQGKGIGRMLMEHLYALARKEKIHRIQLHTEKKLKAYDIYHHMGFTDQSEESVYLTKWI